MTGGWAAKALCEKGLKTLVLERGRNVKHIEDYPTMYKDPWDFKNGGKISQEELRHYEKQNRTGYTTHEQSRHWFVRDTEHPYYEDQRFDWMRGYHVGGRSIMWGRHSYRMSDMDFEANAKDGYGVDWPIRYKDIAPWYSYVEKHIGIAGEALGLPHLPDSEFTPPMEMNCVENHLRDGIQKNFGRPMTIGRVAHYTGNAQRKYRAQCQYRDRCIRGCPFGGYFSALTGTLPHAEETGNMTLRPHSIVHSIMFDEHKKKATGVRVIDTLTRETFEFKADVIFLCASAIASAWVLLNSRSDRFPNGMGNDSGELGHNIMDHHLKIGANAVYDGFKDKYHESRRPTGFYIPRFRNLPGQEPRKDFLRGYGYQGAGSRENWKRHVKELSIGLDLKEDLMKPGPWNVGMTGFGETLPYHENRMYLNFDKPDQWGLPTITFDAVLRENEIAMRKDMKNSAAEMLEAAGFTHVEPWEEEQGVGLGIHEMGTARMGRDPKTSVLNANNQIHSVKNVYVTDGACMTSASCQNPSLTYMALTARAVDHAVNEKNKGNL
jgi:choline dehydrogenase-like flavoprotein